MAHYRYLFGSWQTAMVDVEIPLYGVYITDRLNDVGYMQGSFNMDQTGKDNAVMLAATTPGKSFLVVLRDNVPIWGGYVTSRTYQSQSKSCQLYARAYEGYLDEVILPRPDPFDGINAVYDWGEEDQKVHFYLIMGQEGGFWFDETSAGPLFPMQFEEGFLIEEGDPEFDSLTPDEQFWDMRFTGVTRDLVVPRYDYKTCKSVIDSMANGLDGFDWRIVPRLVIDDNALSDIGQYIIPPNSIQVLKIVRFGYPYLNFGQDYGGLIFEYPGNILNYYRTDNLAGAGTTIIGVGGGQGEEMLRREVTFPELVNHAGGFFPRDVVVPMKDIEDQNILNARTEQEAMKRRPPKLQYKVTVRPDMLENFDTNLIGSPATLIVKDPMHPVGASVQVRINEYALSPPSAESGAEEIALGFVGDVEE